MPQSNLDDIGKLMDQQYHRDGDVVSILVKADLALGTEHKSYQDFLAFVGRNWNDLTPQWGGDPAKGVAPLPFRSWLLRNWGPDHFVTLSEDAHQGGHLPPPVAMPTAPGEPSPPGGIGDIPNSVNPVGIPSALPTGSTAPAPDLTGASGAGVDTSQGAPPGLPPGGQGG